MQPHEYSIIGHNRASIGRGLWIVATLVASTAVLVLAMAKKWAESVGIPQSVSNSLVFPVSAGAIYTFGFFAFNRWAWKWPWVYRFLSVPDLSGKWLCEGETIGGEGIDSPRHWKGKMTITQTWDKIRVYLMTETSDSKSVAASILHEPDRGYVLMYSYRNEPRLSTEKMSSHVGYCELVLDPELTEANGDYFNNKGRVTWGRMRLQKIRECVA